jgi:hypothetical protein
LPLTRQKKICNDPAASGVQSFAAAGATGKDAHRQASKPATRLVMAKLVKNLRLELNIGPAHNHRNHSLSAITSDGTKFWANASAAARTAE